MNSHTHKLITAAILLLFTSPETRAGGRSLLLDEHGFVIDPANVQLQPLDPALTSLAAGSDAVQFSGPSGTTKVFSLPNSNATLLYEGGPVTATTITASDSVTATAFIGDGSHLTGISSSAISGLNWSQIGSTPTTLDGYGITNAQPLDSALTSLAAGSDFVQFSGPSGTTKVFSLPNSNATLLYDGGIINGTTLTISGNATLGDASGDNVTINGAVTAPNATSTSSGHQLINLFTQDERYPRLGSLYSIGTIPCWAGWTTSPAGAMQDTASGLRIFTGTTANTTAFGWRKIPDNGQINKQTVYNWQARHAVRMSLKVFPITIDGIVYFKLGVSETEAKALANLSSAGLCLKLTNTGNDINYEVELQAHNGTALTTASAGTYAANQQQPLNITVSSGTITVSGAIAGSVSGGPTVGTSGFNHIGFLVNNGATAANTEAWIDNITIQGY